METDVPRRKSLVRATRRWRPRAAALVDRILSRHARGCVTVAPLDAVVRRVANHTTTHVDSRQIVDLAAHLRLACVTRLATVTRERTAGAAFAPWRPAPPIAAPATMPAPAAVHTILERLFSRERRVETRVHERPIATETPVAFRPELAPSAVSLPYPRTLVVRHSTVVVEPVRAGAGERGAIETPKVQATAVAEALTPAIARARPIPLSPWELNRLTEQVVRTIDQRIVSHRERLGVAG
jgi:hypothetical protein